MQRICSTLCKNGFNVVLVGVLRRNSTHLSQQLFEQKRIKVFFEKGFLFYAEYNIKLLFFLLFNRFDYICSIDLDTIIAGYFASKFKRKKRVYDAHELFTELNEVVNSKRVKWFWNKVENIFVPKFKKGYTVNDFIKEEFKRRYDVEYAVIRNLPFKNFENNQNTIKKEEKPFFIYQGAVNRGRGFEQLIPAMQFVEGIDLRIYGTGNFYEETQQLIIDHGLADKVFLMGSSLPNELKKITPTAKFGITIFEDSGLNQIHSLANRFFDYIMAGIPQICIDFNEYRIINNKYNIAYMISDTKPETLAKSIIEMNENINLQTHLKNNCIQAREELNWENESKTLINFWKNI